VKKLLFALFAILFLMKFCSCNYGKEAQGSEIVMYTLTKIDTVWRFDVEKVMLTWEAKNFVIKNTWEPLDHHFYLGMRLYSLR
jgi:hypothetical protein